jgi:hypothetical protein
VLAGHVKFELFKQYFERQPQLSMPALDSPTASHHKMCTGVHPYDFAGHVARLPRS